MLELTGQFDSRAEILSLRLRSDLTYGQMKDRDSSAREPNFPQFWTEVEPSTREILRKYNKDTCCVLSPHVLPFFASVWDVLRKMCWNWHIKRSGRHVDGDRRIPRSFCLVWVVLFFYRVRGEARKTRWVEVWMQNKTKTTSRIGTEQIANGEYLHVKHNGVLNFLPPKPSFPPPLNHCKKQKKQTDCQHTRTPSNYTHTHPPPHLPFVLIITSCRKAQRMACNKGY